MEKKVKLCDYDKRSSCSVDVGTTYPAGKRQPVGHEGNPKQFVSSLPQIVKLMGVSEKTSY